MGIGWKFNAWERRDEIRTETWQSGQEGIRWCVLPDACVMMDVSMSSIPSTTHDYTYMSIKPYLSPLLITSGMVGDAVVVKAISVLLKFDMHVSHTCTVPCCQMWERVSVWKYQKGKECHAWARARELRIISAICPNFRLNRERFFLRLGERSCTRERCTGKGKSILNAAAQRGVTP